ncbi:hypothetical protein AX16_008681 [Volvariella volvacea WC 439]|nr:hypothetical protein AX16_008681 [Volvariella volvacea WC 439]
MSFIAQSKAKGIYPLLTVPDIIAALAGWDLNVSAEQLNHPNPDFVEHVYLCCLKKVTNVELDTFQEPMETTLSAFLGEEQEMYSLALSNVMILIHLSRFARAARFDDFHAKDLSQPDRQRTLKILSAFINFVKFTEQSGEEFVKNLRQQSITIVKDRNRSAEHLEETRGKITELRNKLVLDQPHCEAITKENAELVNQIKQQKKTQTQLMHQKERLKEERKELGQKKSGLRAEIEGVERSIDRTRERVVQSPDRLKRAISSMHANVAQDKKTLNMQESRSRELQQKILSLFTIEQELQSCIEQLKVIEKEVEQLNHARAEHEELRRQLDEKHLQRTELLNKKELLEKQLAMAQEKLERTRRYAEDKRSASQHTLERLQQEYEAMAVERRDNDRQVEQVRAEADQLEVKIVEELRRSEQELNELLAEYWKLRHETDVYMETLANKLNMKVHLD